MSGLFDEFLEPQGFKTKGNVKNMNPQFMQNFEAMAQEYYQATGKPLVINDAWRSYATQAAAHKKKPQLAAKPGHSLHEQGMAMDIDEIQAGELDQLGLFNKYGFYRPMMGQGQKYEPWHIQMAEFERKAPKIAAAAPGGLFDEFLKEPEKDKSKDSMFGEFLQKEAEPEKSVAEQLGVPAPLRKAGRAMAYAAELPGIKQGLKILSIPPALASAAVQPLVKQMKKVPALGTEQEVPLEAMYPEMMAAQGSKGQSGIMIKTPPLAETIGMAGEQAVLAGGLGLIGKASKAAKGSELFKEARRIFAPETAGPKALRTAEEWVEQMGAAHAKYAQADHLADTYRTMMGKISPQERLHISSLMERGEPVPPEWQPYAQARKEMFDWTWGQIDATGKEIGYIQNYHPHLFKDTPQSRAYFSNVGRRPFEGSKRYFKQRTRLEDMETLNKKYGLEPLFDNPIDQDLAQYLEQLKFIHAHKFLNNLRKERLLKFVPHGKKVPIDEDWVRLSDHTRASARLFEVWSSTPKPVSVKGAKLVSPEQMKIQWSPPSKMGEYYAPREVADLIDNHFSPGRQSLWLTKYQNAVAAWNAWHVAWSGFHGTATTVHDISMGFAQGIPETFGKLFAGDFKGAAQAAAKMEPITRAFRTYRLGKKAQQEALAPGTNPNLSYIAGYGLKGGMRAKQIHPLSQATAHSLTEFLNSIFHEPGKAFRTAIRVASKPIMEYYVPRIKWGAFVRRFQRESEKIMAEYGGKAATGAQKTQMMNRLRSAAYQERQFIENIFGELAYDNLHMSQGLLRSLKFLIGYPGWNIGTFRWMGGMVRAPYQAVTGMDTQTKRAAEFGLGILASNAIFNSLMQYSMTGEWPQDWKDVMIGARTGRTLSNGAPERLGVASYMKDALGMLYHPGKTIANKEMFVFRIGSELYNNKDWQGVEIRSPQKPLPWQAGQIAKHLGVAAAMPFGPASVQQAPSIPRGVGAFMGLTPRSREYSNTPAQQMMDEELQRQAPAIRTQEQAEASKQRKEILQKGREDPFSLPVTVRQSVQEKQLTKQQAKNLMVSAKQPPMVATYHNIKNLEAAIRIFRAGSEEEKKLLAPELARKIAHSHPEQKRKYMSEIKELIPVIKQYLQGR